MGTANDPVELALEQIRRAESSRAKRLWLRGLPLTDLPNSFCIALMRLTHLQELRMGSSDLSALPDSFGAALGHLSNLRNLYLEHIPIKRLPGSFSSALKKLTKLREVREP